MSIKKIIPTPLKSLYHKANWFLKNYGEISKFSLLQPNHFDGPVTYNTDGLTTSNNADFIHEPRFVKAYAAALTTNPWKGFTLQWRVYIVCWFADFVKHLDGDYVECGVNTGAYSRAVIDYVDFNKTGKTFFLLDTYEGFPDEQMSEEEKKAGIGFYGGNHYKDVYEQVKQNFAPFNARIIKGRVPDTLPQCTTEKIAYLSIDMNAVAPEIAAAGYFWDKLVAGGVIVLDDYGFPLHINQKLAFDRFAKEKGVEILCLPTGQGVIIKR